jgi:5-dehydro-2-deoxygluconokinase
MFNFAAPRNFDVVCIGRVGVDLYAAQKNLALELVTQFNKSVGGSPANIATAVARLGGKSGVISLVADDGLGRFVTHFLRSNGVDTSCVGLSPSRELTSLALTEIRPTNCQVVIYRQNAADLQLQEADINAQYIASSRVLLITGTALSAEPSRSASYKAIEYARAAGTRVVLDLDYRPYGWTSNTEAADVLGKACRLSDIVIGNEEEFSILPNSHVESMLSPTTQAVVLKMGARGCHVYMHDALRLAMGVYHISPQKPMGSGDAFAGALLWALCQGKTWSEALSYGTAAAAIPTRIALEKFMSEHSIGEPPN